MDVSLQLDRCAEPRTTARLHEVVARVRQRLTPWQRRDMTYWADAGPFERPLLQALRADLDDGARLRDHHAGSARRRSHPVSVASECFELLPGVLARAAAKPAITSAVVWTWLGADDPVFASHLLQLVRARADLPGLRRPIAGDDPRLRTARGDLASLAAAMAELQVEDACVWLERIATPLGPDEQAPLAAQLDAIERARAGAPQLPPDLIAGFLRRAASYLVQLSARGLDPLGFPLGREAQLDADPALERRLEITAWARRAGHRVRPRGRMVVLSLPVEAPWPLRLELITAELGLGHAGGLVLLLRLHAGGTIAVTAHVPVLLWFPGEPPEELGPRFERWLALAYPHATAPWRAWS